MLVKSFLTMNLIFHINPTLYDNRNSHIKYFVSIYVQSLNLKSSHVGNFLWYKNLEQSFTVCS